MTTVESRTPSRSRTCCTATPSSSTPATTKASVRTSQHAVITTDGSDHETKGADAVAAMYHATTRKYEDGTPLTKHVITNPIVTVADDGLTGTCRSYYTVLQKAPDAPLRPIITGRYRDEFEKVDGEWRFSRRHMGIDQVGDLSLHLLITLR